MTCSPLGPYTFLHKINTFGVKIRLVFKEIHDIDFIKNETWKPDTAKIITDFNYLNIPGFWRCPGSKYTKVLKMPGLQRVMKMPETFLNMHIYAWIWLNMSQYAWITEMLEAFYQYINPELTMES